MFIVCKARQVYGPTKSSGGNIGPVAKKKSVISFQFLLNELCVKEG